MDKALAKSFHCPDMSGLLRRNRLPDSSSGGTLAPVQSAAQRPRFDLFLVLALAYLAVPNLIFLLGWVRPAIGIPVAFIVVGAFIWFIQHETAPASRPRLTPKLSLVVFGTALFLTLFAGVGAVFGQSEDYTKHNLLFHDLAVHPWPVKYSLIGGSEYLCYSLGYYLVPSALSQVTGAALLPALTILWTTFGLALFFYWLVTFEGATARTLLIFLLFSSTSALWSFFKAHGLPGLISPADLEPKLLQNGLLYNYSDTYTRFHYQPQHALAAWLGAALLLDRLWRRADPRGTVFIWALCVLWSPLTCLSLLLIPLACWGRARWQNYLEPINLIGGGAVLAVMGIYYLGHQPLAGNGFIWQVSPDLGWILFYLLFLAFSLTPVLFLALFEFRYRVLEGWRPLFFIAAAALVLLPLYKFGNASDLRMQSSGPAFLIFALATDRIFRGGTFTLRRPLGALLAASLLLGAIYPIGRLALDLVKPPPDYSYAHVAATLGWREMPDMRDADYDLSTQYLGRGDSLAARWLLR